VALFLKIALMARKERLHVEDQTSVLTTQHLNTSLRNGS
jgi:hypothetical protein